MSDDIVHISDGSFEADVLNADRPVLIDFWAEWCGPCKMIAPILEGIAGDYKERLQIAKLNVDDNPQTAARFGARSIPTLAMVRGGETVVIKAGSLFPSGFRSTLSVKASLMRRGSSGWRANSGGISRRRTTPRRRSITKKVAPIIAGSSHSR